MDGPPAKRAKSVMEELRKTAVLDGEEVVHQLPILAQELQAQVKSRFFYSDLGEAEKDFEQYCTAAVLDEAQECPKTRELSRFVRDEVDLACRRFTALEAWLKLKTPKIEDGNNFGVDVQKQFVSVIQDYRNYAWKELCALKNHSWNRAVVSESTETPVTEERSESCELQDGKAVSHGVSGLGSGLIDSVNDILDGKTASHGVSGLGSGFADSVKDSKLDGVGSAVDGAGVSGAASNGTVVKTSRMVRQNTNKMPHVQHYRRYVKDLEIEFYFKLRHTARNLTQYYMDAYDMFEKNWEKILHPRGQQGSACANMY